MTAFWMRRPALADPEVMFSLQIAPVWIVCTGTPTTRSRLTSTPDKAGVLQRLRHPDPRVDIMSRMSQVKIRVARAVRSSKLQLISRMCDVKSLCMCDADCFECSDMDWHL